MLSQGYFKQVRNIAPSEMQWRIALAAGLIPNWSLVQKFGRNPVVPNGSWAYIDNLGHTNFGAFTAPTTVRIKAGGHVDDDSDGDGSQSIQVEGIDSNLVLATANITTNGASASDSTSTQFWRIHKAKALGNGTQEVANSGNIIIETTAGDFDKLEILADEGRSQAGRFTIPLGKQGFLLTAHATIEGTKSCNVRLKYRHNFNTISAPFPSNHVALQYDGVMGHVDLQPDLPYLVLPALTDVWVEAYGNGALASATTTLEIILIDT